MCWGPSRSGGQEPHLRVLREDPLGVHCSPGSAALGVTAAQALSRSQPSTSLLSAWTQRAGPRTKPTKAQGGAPGPGGPGSPGSGSRVYLPCSRAPLWPGRGGSPKRASLRTLQNPQTETGDRFQRNEGPRGPRFSDDRQNAPSSQTQPDPCQQRAMRPRHAERPPQPAHQHHTAWTTAEGAARTRPEPPPHGTLTVLRSIGCLMMSW